MPQFPRIKRRLQALLSAELFLCVKGQTDSEREARTLYYASGSKYKCRDGISAMLQDDTGDQAVLIVSEKLNNRKDEWTAIPHNHFIAVENKLDISLHPLECC